jgi:selenocysteine lyase/cysteine desulfurase
MNPAEARALFPGLRDRVFLDTGAMGLVPEPARLALRALVDLATEMKGTDTEEVYESMDAERARARRAVAILIRASLEEVALVESTTHGLNLAALALPVNKRDEILMPDTEFLQVPIPWARLAEEKGARLRFFSTRGGRFDVEDIERAVTARTRVLTFSSVQWSSGFRCDAGAIARFCRRLGIYTVVDAIQHVGVAPFDVRRIPADFVACGGHKWLNAPMGCGFLYVRRALLKNLSPPIRGYQGLGEPRGGWERYFQRPSITPDRAFRFPKKAKAFETGGTANYPGAVALAVATELANSIGSEAIESHVRALTERFIAGAERVGLRVVSSFAPSERAGIVVVRAFPEPAADLELVRQLREEGILVSMRYTSGIGGIRVSMHYFNDESDVDRVLDAIEQRARRAH